jgi:thiamine-phosphate pyrophosphorylase
MSTEPACRLYLITPPRLDAAAFSRPLAQALDAGDVAAVQLRLKNVDDDAVAVACDALRPVVQGRGVALILNDRPDIAAKTGCDGVHIGQDDASLAEARRLLGAEATVGVTCHASRHLAMVAAEAGADYVAFGAFFPTATKETRFHARPELLAWWSALMTVPCVAIGGIDAANCAGLVAAGADFLAVSSSVWDHRLGPAQAVREMNAVIAATPRGLPDLVADG